MALSKEMARLLQVLRPGVVEYEKAVALQRNLVEQLWRNEKGEEGYLILLEHPPVVTVGRNGDRGHIVLPPEEMQRRGIAVCETNRGGDVTWHGPGQLVAYPIVRLEQHGKDLHRYLRRLEDVIIATLSAFGIQAEREPPRRYRKADGTDAPMTGVWVGERKIASIGIAVTHWIAYHGAALNVSNDLREHEVIHPCGMPEVRMTSMAEQLGTAPAMAQVEDRFAASFAEEFGFRLTFSERTY